MLIVDQIHIFHSISGVDYFGYNACRVFELLFAVDSQGDLCSLYSIFNRNFVCFRSSSQANKTYQCHKMSDSYQMCCKKIYINMFKISFVYFMLSLKSEKDFHFFFHFKCLFIFDALEIDCLFSPHRDTNCSLWTIAYLKVILKRN